MAASPWHPAGPGYRMVRQPAPAAASPSCLLLYSCLFFSAALRLMASQAVRPFPCPWEAGAVCVCVRAGGSLAAVSAGEQVVDSRDTCSTGGALSKYQRHTGRPRRTWHAHKRGPRRCALGAQTHMLFVYSCECAPIHTRKSKQRP